MIFFVSIFLIYTTNVNINFLNFLVNPQLQVYLTKRDTVVCYLKCSEPLWYFNKLYLQKKKKPLLMLKVFLELCPIFVVKFSVREVFCPNFQAQ